MEVICVAKEKKLKEERREVPSFEDFRTSMMTKAFYRTCPWICLALRCPYVEKCWELKKAKE